MSSKKLAAFETGDSVAFPGCLANLRTCECDAVDIAKELVHMTTDVELIKCASVVPVRVRVRVRVRVGVRLRLRIRVRARVQIMVRVRDRVRDRVSG